MVRIAVGEIVAHRFFVGNAPRGKCTVLSVCVVDTGLGIEEIPFAVYGKTCHTADVPVVVVRYAIDGVFDMPVLQVGESRKVAVDIISSAGIDVCVEFAAFVVVVFLQRIDRAHVVAHPCHIAEMMTVEIIHRAAEYHIPPVLLIVDVHKTAAESVLIVFQPHEIRFGHLDAVGVREVVKTVFHQSAPGLVLIVVSVILGVVQRGAHAPVVAESLRQVKLKMVLREEILLITVVSPVTLRIGILSTGIVAPSVFLHILFAGIVPCHISLLFAAEGDETHKSAVVAVCGLAEITPQLRRSTLDISVASHMGDTGIETPVVAQQTGADTESLTVCVVHAVAARQLGIGRL